MKASPLPVAEITATAIALLCRQLGAVNTARFLNQFSTGVGNYTEERDSLLGDATVDQLAAEIKQRRATSRRAKGEHRPARPTRRSI
jgi:hypothetical protein